MSDLSKGRVVAYLGAGFTAVCGLPGWGKLLELLIGKIRSEGAHLDVPGRERMEQTAASAQAALERGKFAYCASIVRTVLDRAIIRDVVQEAFSSNLYRNAPEPDRLRMKRRALNLFRTPVAGVITTNYDTLVEDLMPAISPRQFEKIVGLDPRLGSALFRCSEKEPFYFKMHGSMDAREIVLSTEEYDRQYLSTPMVRRFLSSCMLKYTILFVGCSLEDDIIKIRRELTMDFQGEIPVSYAMLPRSADNEIRASWLRDYAKIESVLYDPRNKHAQLDKALDDLCYSGVALLRQRNGLEISKSVSEYLSMDANTRMREIGNRNKAILHFISRRPGRQIEQITAIQLLGEFDGTIMDPVQPMNAEEFIYRLMFLHQIGLVSERADVAGRVIYKLSDETVRLLNAAGD